MKPRCAIYARVSTEDQAKKFGLDVQLTALRKAVDDRGYSLGREFEFVDDGYSGMDIDRPALGRLRSAAALGQVDIILVYDPDRLSRNLAHQLLLAETFEKSRVRLEFVTTTNDATPEGRMMFNMKGVFAEYERMKFLDRTRRGKTAKALAGHIVGGVAPYGYRFLGRQAGVKGEYQIYEPEAARVREVFGWCLDGMSTRGIVTRLNAVGVPSSKGKAWGKSAVRRLLTNRVYIGEAYFNQHQHVAPANPRPDRKNKKTLLKLRPRSEWIRLTVPAIVADDVFIRTQEQLSKNRSQLAGRSQFTYLLKGLVRCAICGRNYAGCPSHGQRFYRCMGRDRLSVPRCNAPLRSAARLENRIWGIVCQFLRTPDLLASKIREFQSAAALSPFDVSSQLEELQSARKKIEAQEVKLLRDTVNSDFSIDAIDTVARELHLKKGSIDGLLRDLHEKQRRAIQPVHLDHVRERLKWISRGLSKLDMAGRQKVLRAFTGEIRIDGQDISMTCLIPASASLGGSILHPPSTRTDRNKPARSVTFSIAANLDSPDVFEVVDVSAGGASE